MSDARSFALKVAVWTAATVVIFALGEAIEGATGYDMAFFRGWWTCWATVMIWPGVADFRAHKKPAAS